MPKRVGSLFDQVWDYENLEIAHKFASRGKRDRSEVKWVEENKGDALLTLQYLLKNNLYKTSKYRVFNITERGKPREIYVLPYYPDRIVHHAVIQVLLDIWIPWFIRDTYGSIPGRGIHDAVKRITKNLKSDPKNTKYCLKLDIRKFYPSVDHDRLKQHLQRKLKDPQLLTLLFEVIDSAPGIPIGNYLSQYFGNVILTPFDHWLKEVLNIKYYYRYVDDMIILGPDKPSLHKVKESIRIKLEEEKLELKNNWSIFPVDKSGINFLGFIIFRNRKYLRRSIRLRARKFSLKYFKHKIRLKKCRRSMASWYGWARVTSNSKFLRSSIWPIMKKKVGHEPVLV